MKISVEKVSVKNVEVSKDVKDLITKNLNVGSKKKMTKKFKKNKKSKKKNRNLQSATISLGSLYPELNKLK